MRNNNNDIIRFRGEFSFLSNFYTTDVYYDDVKYPSVENAYQAAKCNNIADRSMYENCTASESKALSKIHDRRRNWNVIKEDIMRDLVYQKFTNNLHLQQRLLATSEVNISEGNLHGDTFWGVDLRTGKGSNRLGYILMDVRSDLEINSLINK